MTQESFNNILLKSSDISLVDYKEGRVVDDDQDVIDNDDDEGRPTKCSYRH